MQGSNVNFFVRESYPGAAGDNWYVNIRNDSLGSVNWQVIAICANVYD